MSMPCGITSVPLLYYNSPPFTNLSASGLSINGLLPNSLKSLMSICCSDAENIVYQYVQFANESDMLTAYRSQYNSSAIAVPLFAPTALVSNSIPSQFIPSLSINAFYLLAPQPSHSGSNVGLAMLAALPLIALIWGCTALVAYMLWFIEVYTVREKTHFKKTFGRGILDAFWNSFITASTIGYGDIVVQSTSGRVVICLWITLSLMLFASMTGTFSSVFSAVNSAALEFPGLSGSMVSVLRSSPEFSIVVAAGGFPVESLTISDLVNNIQSGVTSVGLINAYTYQSLVLGFASEAAMLQGLRTQVSTDIFMEAGFVFGNSYVPSGFPQALYSCLNQQNFISQILAAQLLSQFVYNAASNSVADSAPNAGQLVTSQLYMPSEIVGFVSLLGAAIGLIILTVIFFHLACYRRARNKASGKGDSDRKQESRSKGDDAAVVSNAGANGSANTNKTRENGHSNGHTSIDIGENEL